MRHGFRFSGLRLRSLALFALLAAVPAAAQPIRIDTVSVRRVGPGMTYLRLHAPTVPWVISVLEVDLTNPYLDVEAIKARDHKAGGYETTSAMAARRTTPTRRVVGGVNAGFFGAAGAVNGLHVGEGEIVNALSQSGYSSIAVSRDFGAMVGTLGVTLRATIGTTNRAINGVNATRAANQVVLYNRFQGVSTGTDATGTELVARALDPWALNDTMRVVVTQKGVGAGNTAIPAGHVVLSGVGTGATFLGAAAVGDTIRVAQLATPGIPRIDEAVSGYPHLLRDGQKTVLPNTDHHNLRHPRTAMGLNRDTTKLYLVTVDGRQTASAGQTNHEQQDLMLRLGMWHAQGLDGGGSTTMVVEGAVANMPSDGPGTERTVGNAFLIVSTAPRGPLSRLEATANKTRLYRRETAQITVRGTDDWFASVPLDASQVRFEVDPALGTVSTTGLFTAGAGRGTGYVRVRYGTFADSVRISVKGIASVEATPAFVVTDTTRTVAFRTSFRDDDGVTQTPVSGEVAWRVLDTSIGEITTSGVFRGRRAGETFVVADVGSASDTSAVRVEIGTGTRVLDALDDADGWSLGGVAIDTVASTLGAEPADGATGGRALRFDYRFTETSGAAPVALLRTDLPVFGVPDSVNLRIRSDGANHRAFLTFRDAAGTNMTVSVPRYANDSTAFAFMPGPMSRSNYPLASLVFPIRLTGVRLELAYKGGRVSGKDYSGSLWIDDLRATYPARATSIGDREDGPGADVTFLGIAPNPSRSRATVTMRVGSAAPVRVVLYDLLGRAVQTVYDGPGEIGDRALVVETDALPSGVYVLRASGGASTALVVAR